MNDLGLKIETFRGDYTYTNSPDAIRRFPFPFEKDEYMYSVNIEQHKPGAPGTIYEHLFDVDEHYLSECKDKALTMEQDKGRCASLPHMMDAQWDFLQLTMEQLSKDYPEFFSLVKRGNQWQWENKALGIRDNFKFGDVTTLPCDPLEYMGRQTQGDFVLLDQRENNLFSDAGFITSQADWSLAFNIGMSWHEWHGPVPRMEQMGILERGLKFLLSMQQGSPVRRLNWTMTINPRLDTSPEHFPEWGPDKSKVTVLNAGKKAHLRVELQSMFRLPRSNAILFSIRAYLISLDKLATYPRWVKRFHRVLKGLHPDLIEYKGITPYHAAVVKWLEKYDGGEDLGFGTQPE